MIELFWDLYQQKQINDVTRTAISGAGDARRAQTDVRLLETRVDALMLANTAMWSILRDRLKVTDDELNSRIRDIDLRDGRLDGKVATTVGVCSACGRAMSPRHPRCIYCGAEALNAKPFGA
jgi:hypothetical protein